MVVHAPGANRMMSDGKTSGSADSGAGVSVAGFYVPNGVVPTHLKEIEQDFGPFTEIALHESEGWTFFLGVHGDVRSYDTAPVWKLGYFRRESHKFFVDLPVWAFSSRAVRVKRLTIFQSSGSLSLAWLY